MKTLKGMKLKETDFSDIERQLKVLFYQLIFKPIVDLLSPHNAQVKAAKGELRNAKSSSVVSGLLSGKIQYDDSTFSGDFSASISRELRAFGAKYDKRTKTFTALPQALPIGVLEAAKKYQDAARQLHVQLEDRLDQIQKDLERMVNLNPVDAGRTVKKMDRDFNAAYGDALGTDLLSDESKRILAKRYTESLKPYIKKFSDAMIHEIRESVTENAKTGYRFDALVSRIQNRYDVSQSKATFLARQETALFTAQAHQTRFAEVGITSYIWRTAGDSEVRPDHKKLNGQEFEYAHPPIVDESTGRRANPGCDFNCRCSPEPVLPGVLA